MLAVAVIMYIWLLCIWTFIPQTSGVSAMNRKGCLFSPLINDLRRSYSSRNHGDGTRQTARNGFTPQFIAADDERPLKSGWSLKYQLQIPGSVKT